MTDTDALPPDQPGGDTYERGALPGKNAPALIQMVHRES